MTFKKKKRFGRKYEVWGAGKALFKTIFERKNVDWFLFSLKMYWCF